MTDTSSVSIFVPIFVLVIIEISNVARDMDIREIATKKQGPFFYSIFYFLDKTSQDALRIPQLGPFNFIHGMNLGILFLGYTLTITTSTGSIRIIAGLIVYLIWVLFPMIEVDEYVSIMDDPDTTPMSFLYHSVLTTLAAAVIFSFGGIINGPTALIRNQLYLIGFLLVVVLLYYMCLFGFLRLLERELEQSSSNRGYLTPY